MDRVWIRDLKISCILGVMPEERREKQDVLVNLRLSTDLQAPATSDRFEDAVDYRAIKRRILGLVEQSHFYLVEALAQAVANLCLEPPAVRLVWLRVEKPGALRFAQSVGVEMVRRRHAPERVFVGVGSNLQPADNLRQALHLLGRYAKIVALSNVYLTAPEGRAEQPPYFNCVWEIETQAQPLEFKLQVLRRIEADLGRVRTADRYAARPIDLDLILYGDRVSETPELRLPDPDIGERAYLAAGLAELAPDLNLPRCNLRLADLAAKLQGAQLTVMQEYTQSLKRELTNECQARPTA